MGQKIGKAIFIREATPFTNLRSAALDKLWEGFNDIADGFGLTQSEFVEILETLELELLVPQKELNEMSVALFEALDTDSNELVDAMEFLGTLAMCSAMELQQKVAFTFACYDFDESDALTIDEMTLAMKSTVTGLCKLCAIKTEPPLEVEVERLSQEAFLSAGLSKQDKLPKAKFSRFCLQSPEIVSWMKYFDDIREVEDSGLLGGFTDTEDGDIAQELSTGGVPRTPGVEVITNRASSARAMFRHAREAEQPQDAFNLKQWQQVVVEPSDMPDIKTGMPPSTLELQWMYGCRAQDSRNMVRYNSDSHAIFFGANLAVRLDIENHKQSFFQDHSDSVLCMAMHPMLDICATGANGSNPEIIVWNTLTMQTLSVIKGFHKGGVTHLAFSPAGEFLLSVGADPGHSVAVYNWEKGGNATKIFSEVSDKKKVLSCCFKNEYTFITAGVNHIYFWQKNESGAFVKKSGKFGRSGHIQPIMCVGATEKGLVVSGSASGHLYLWQGRNCKFVIYGHEGPVMALFVYDNSVISGGKDGKIRLFQVHGLEIEARQAFDFKSVGPRDVHIRSICCCPLRKRILVTSKASEIFEVSIKDGINIHRGSLITGHYAGELWGLAMHPERNEFATVGDDHTLRVWDATTCDLIKQTNLKWKGRCVAYSPDGMAIAVGLGCGDKSVYEGMLQIFNEDDLTVLYEARDTKKRLMDIKYEPGGNMMAISSFDKAIYIYNCEDGDYSPRAKCRGHKGPVTHLDWDEPGKRIQSADASYTQLYWDAETGEVENGMGAMRDVQWNDVTVPFGWGVQGIWPVKQYGTEINAVCRSRSGLFVLSGDNFGRLKLYNYPVPSRNPQHHQYRGHSVNLTNVRYSFDDKYVVTTGGEDRCVLQWKNVMTDHEDTKPWVPDDQDSEEEETYYTREKVAFKDEVAACRTNDFTQVYGAEDASKKDNSKFKAQRPWKSNAIAPTRPPKDDQRRPYDIVSLEWINGYRSKDMRQSVRYNAANRVVYSAACVGIVLDKYKRKQQHYCKHTDAIVSLAMHPGKVMVATGELGRYPKIFVWDSSNLETMAELSGFHQDGVCLLAFSNGGSLLVSAGLDAANSIGVYEWRTGLLKAVIRGGPLRVLDVQFTPDDTAIIQCGINHIRQHHLPDGGGRNVCSEDAALLKGAVVQPFYSIAFFNDRILVGAFDGHIYILDQQGLTMLDKFQGHGQPVNCMHATEEGLCTGGKDGFVKLWDKNYECTCDHDMTALETSFNCSVRSLYWNSTDNAILVGTRGCEIYEISGEDGSDLNGRPMVYGHSAYEVWGLAVHPARLEYATTGDDETLRVWDIGSKQMIRSTKLDCISRCVCYNPDASIIAVGLGGNIGKGKQRKAGAYMILSSTTLEVMHEGKDSKQWISDIRYTPDGNTLGVASRDNNIYLYDVANGYLMKAKFSKHNSYITHFDFSTDCQYMMSNCGAMELHFADATNGVHLPRASVLKDVHWQTVTCPFSWPMQGLHAKESSGIQIHSCDRALSGNLAVSTDNMGQVRLYRSPCLAQDAGCTYLRGHEPNVRNAKFAFGDQYLVTVGGDDRCTFHWKVFQDPDDDHANVAGESGEDSQLMEPSNVATDYSDKVAVKPWLGTIVPPTNPPEPVKDPPALSLELECIHGYRAQDSRNNVRYNYKGEVVYSAAGLGVVYSKEDHRQRHFSKHTGDIVSLAMHPNGQYVATGEKGDSPCIWVWDATSGNAICQLSTPLHRGGIPVLNFSRDGHRLVSIGNHANHIIAVWSSLSGNWGDGTLTAYAFAGKQRMHFACFLSTAGEFQLLSGGVNVVSFWTLQGRVLRGTRGYFGRKGKLQPIVCATTLRRFIVTGTVSGHLYIWDEEKRAIIQSLKAHDSTVNAIYTGYTSAGEYMVTGGKEGVIKLWDATLHCRKAYHMREAKPQSRNVSVRSVCLNQVGNTILVGTQGSEIYEVTNIQALADITRATLLQRGHCKDELWGLATHPTDPDLFATVGDDHTLRVWSVRLQRPTAEITIETVSRCVCWSADGKMMALGLGGRTRRGRTKKDGAFVVLDASTLTVIHEGRDSREWISDIKFSPDGTLLGVASNDNILYLYDAEDGFPLISKCEKHSSFLTHFDFSEESTYIQTNCGAFERLYFNASDGEVIFNPSNLKDERWDSWTCTLGWPVQGIWPDVPDGNNVNAAHKAKNKPVLAIVTERGEIKLFHYPCLTKRAEWVSGFGFSNALSNVRFTCDDATMITISRDTRTIAQWKVKHEEDPAEAQVAAEYSAAMLANTSSDKQITPATAAASSTK